MSEIFIGDGQSPTGESGTYELAPPVIVAPPVSGTIDFDFAGGLPTGPPLSLAGVGNTATAGWVRLITTTGKVISARRTRVGAMGVTDVLESSRAREWIDPLIDVGSGTTQLLDNDTNLVDFVWDGNDLIEFLLGDDIAYTAVVETPKRISLDPGEEPSQGWVVGGRGHLSLVERAVVYPNRGVGHKPVQEDRLFDWTSEDYDDTSWPAGHVVTYVYWVTPTPAGGGGSWGGFVGGAWDSAFGDGNAAIIWSTAGSTTNAPTGKAYIRQWFNVSGARKRLLQGEADNAADYFLNGVLVLSTTGWTQMSQAEVDVDDGWNLMATVCENWSPSGPFNPAGSAWTLLEYAYPVVVAAHSDASAKVLAYPASVPGMPVGMVMRLVVEEAQARGALPWLVLGFTDTHDADGVPWPIVQISTKVGTDLLTFFSKELAETYIDLWMAPGSTTLYAWNKGRRGNVSGLTVHAPTDPTAPTTGNLTALSHELVL